MIEAIANSGALPLIGVLLGFILGRRERNQRRPVMYACECRHSLSRHRAKPKDTRCMHGNCSCQNYIGPKPPEDYLALEQSSD